MPRSEEDPVVSVSLTAMLAERVGNHRTMSAQGDTVREVISTLDRHFQDYASICVLRPATCVLSSTFL